MRFEEGLASALAETGAPEWEEKKRVPTNHQAKLVITPEIRRIIKVLARRYSTSMCTVTWFSLFNLWKELGNSAEEFTKIMIDPLIDSMSHGELQQFSDTLAKKGIIR